jgi:hypothetical protein
MIINRDITYSILSWLPAHDLARARKVNRDFRQIASEEDFWHKLVQRDWKQNRKTDLAATWAESYRIFAVATKNIAANRYKLTKKGRFPSPFDIITQESRIVGRTMLLIPGGNKLSLVDSFGDLVDEVPQEINIPDATVNRYCIYNPREGTFHIKIKGEPSTVVIFPPEGWTIEGKALFLEENLAFIVKQNDKIALALWKKGNSEILEITNIINLTDVIFRSENGFLIFSTPLETKIWNIYDDMSCKVFQFSKPAIFQRINVNEIIFEHESHIKAYNYSGEELFTLGKSAESIIIILPSLIFEMKKNTKKCFITDRKTGQVKGSINWSDYEIQNPNFCSIAELGIGLLVRVVYRVNFDGYEEHFFYNLEKGKMIRLNETSYFRHEFYPYWLSGRILNIQERGSNRSLSCLDYTAMLK